MFKATYTENPPKRREIEFKSALPVFYAAAIVGGTSFMGMLVHLFYSVMPH